MFKRKVLAGALLAGVLVVSFMDGRASADFKKKFRPRAEAPAAVAVMDAASLQAGSIETDGMRRRRIKDKRASLSADGVQQASLIEEGRLIRRHGRKG